MVSIDTLADDIYSLLAGRLVGDPTVLAQFGPRLGEVLSQRFKDKAEERIPALRMSAIGRPLRQQWYDLNGVKAEALDGKTHLKFLYGDIIESIVLVLAEASGHKVERLQEEIEVDGIKGHIDAVIDGHLVDVKSASPYGYQKFRDGSLFTNDTFGYVGQISGYGKAVSLPAVFIAVNKVSGDICTLSVPQEVIDNYDIHKRIETVRSAVSLPTAPERCYEDEPDGKSGNRKLSVPCSYCGFKQFCWSDINNGKGLRGFAYSDGPRYLTNVVLTPKVFEINN